MRIPEDKYTRFPNEALEALLRMKLSGAHMTVFLYVLRKTTGYQKERENISIRDIARETGYSRRWLIGITNDLMQMGMLKITPGKPGKMSVFEILEPKYWDKVVNSTSPVNCTSQGGEVYFTGVVNSTSPQGVNSTWPDGVNSTSPHKRKKEKRKYLKKGTTTSDDCSSSTKENEEDGAEIFEPEGPDEGWEDPMVIYQRWKEEQTRNGYL